ncbi:MAG: NAD(P)-dependent oxidoreductase [Bacteroidota bacterium]|nr:NAD(P)-dependent oxidoreductase [Bacteroidota bacterium]
MNKPSIGWIGLGNMGIPMCKNIMKNGYALTVFNRTKEKEKPLTEAGASTVERPALLLLKCDIVFTMVSDDEAAKEVYVGKDGLLSKNEAKPKLIINTSTLSPETSKGLAAQCSDKGVEYLEAPVSGSVKPAEDAALIILCSGPEEVFEKAKPVLECLGKKVMHLGDWGAASVAKLAINLLVGFTVQGLAETVLFAQHHGIDKEQMLQIINEGGCGNATTKAKTPSILSGDFTPSFTVKNYAKDLRLAKGVGVETPMANAVFETYQNALKEYENEDLMAVIQFLDKEEK